MYENVMPLRFRGTWLSSMLHYSDNSTYINFSHIRTLYIISPPDESPIDPFDPLTMGRYIDSDTTSLVL